ncbi:hypothetical protein PVAND_010079 [Polypedilum vanderplanki]|uniref:Ig-like domain-containing protein n=1 Tax=Polypedilum vanderplanki TaxID=319348 RepID=A0A9J6CG42_POLVA|nr:hypothetical protein PVAND_010079 [Polypedilum vanderplanki]
MSLICVVLLTFVAAINTKLFVFADKPFQNITTVLSVSELYSELNVVSDNICNNHGKNVAIDVILIDSRATAINEDESRLLYKRHASSYSDNRKNFKDRPRIDQKSLLLVFDGTGSMHDDLKQLRSGAEEIIHDFSTREDSPIFNYVLVVFRDPNVEAPFETRKPEELLEKLKWINVSGGGDCPEMALNGLRIALKLALPNSLAFVFSDASAKDYSYYNEVVELIQAKQVTVNFLLTGDCDDQTSLGYKIYHQLSRVSNGQVYDMNKNNVKDVLVAIRHTMSHNYAALKSVDVENAGTSKTNLNVDKSITKLSVSITGENPTLSIRNPSNETVHSDDSLTLKNLKLVNIKDPNEGIWRIEAKADSSHSIRLSALSNLKFEFGFSLNDVEKKTETSHQPLVGHQNILSVFISDPSLVNELSNVTIFLVPSNPSEISTKFTIPLNKKSENHYETKPFDIPRQMFKIQLNGMDIHGNALERLLSTGLISSFGSAPEVNIEASQKEIYENDNLYLKCYVSSLFPVNITLLHNEQVIKQLFSNQSNELEFNIDDIKHNHSGNYKCLAVNNIGNQIQDLTIKVLSIPQVKLSTNWQEMKENSSYTLKCNLDRIKEMKVEILWLDNEDNILKIGNETYNFIAHANDHGKIIKCRIQTNEFTIEDSMKLDVQFSPKFTNNQQNFSSIQIFGAKINLDCKTNENPRKDFVQWFFTPKSSSIKRKIAVNNEDYISQVLEEGLYECLVSNKIGNVKRSWNISSLIPKESPKIILSNDVIIANQSEDVELACECYSCLPITNFTWIHDSINFQTYFSENIQENSFKTFMKIYNVSEVESGSFECKMQNKLGEDKVLIELLVQTIPKIDAILINDESKKEVSEIIEAIENEELSLECIIDGFPEPNVFWTKNDEKFVDDAFMYFKKLSIDDDGIYVCVSENSLGVTKKNVEIDVQYAPRKKRHIETDLEFYQKSRVILECDLVGNPKPNFLWFKNSKEIIVNEKYQMNNGNSILNFEATSVDDNGIYECIGFNKHGNLSIEFTVVILVAPKILQSNDEVIVIKKDEQLKLICDAFGYPLPQVRFVKDNIILSQKSTFELKYATPNISGIIHCIAENKAGNAEKIFYINIVQQPQIISHFENLTLKAFETRKIICEAEGIPIPNIQWIHEGGEMLSSNEILTLNSSSKQGTILCEAINSQGKDAKYFNLDIIKKPVILPIVKDLQTIQNVRENDDLELICPFENYDFIKWTFNNKTLDEINHKIIDKKLIIYNINRFSNGDWSCNVSNSAGNDSFSYNISILASPIIYASWNLNDRISDFLFTESDIDEKVFKLGEKLKLNCTAEGSPTPKIQWRKSADLISEGEIFEIENLQFHHSDIYTCSAKNNQGAVKKFFKVEVISSPIIDDSLPLQKEFQKSIGDSVLLKCSSIIANPPPLYFWLKDGEILDDESDDHLQIDNLDVSHDGKYRCIAKNRHGSAKIDFIISIYEPAKIIKAEEDHIAQRNDQLPLKLSCISRGHPLPIISWILNGHIMSTTSKLNIEKLFKTINDESIYFDGYGNAINYLDPFRVHLSKQKFYSQLTRIDSKTLKLDIVYKNREHLQSTKFNCYSFNALGRDERSVEVSVKKKPYIKEKNLHYVQEQEILEHLPLLLSCLIDGVPEPKIIWYKNRQQIYENETIKFLNNNKFLSIEETFSWHTGNYSCFSKNSEGELELNFNVVILSPPKVSEYTIIPSSEMNYFKDKSRTLQNNGSDNEINVLRGEDVVLECWVEASPQAKIHWVKLNFYDSSKNDILKESKNFLTLNDVKESSSYLCHANNSVGSIQKLFFINVQHAPEFISNNKLEEHVTVKLHHSINFECRIKSSPEATISWSHNSTSLAHFDNDFYFTSDRQILQIINVNKNHEGKFVCTAENELGKIQKVFYVTVEVPIRFTPWSEWSECTVSCGTGQQYRSRVCILLDGTPSYNCTGDNVQVRKCNDIKCPINGGWSSWSKWSVCPICYDEKIKKPFQKRSRKCDSPIPAFGGLQCDGLDVEERVCAIGICPINGGWSNWSTWSACSKSCGKGYKNRTRICNNPTPKYNGKYCEGDNAEYEECTIKPCNNYSLRKSLDKEDYQDNEIIDSTEHFREIAEFEIKSDENGEHRPYLFMQHREIEYSPPPKRMENLPKIKITLDTYKPISKDVYEQHLNDISKNEIDDEQLDDYFEASMIENSSEADSFVIESTTTEKYCGKGFKYNSIYRQCEEIDECKFKDTCKRTEKCINTIGSYRCEKI